MTGNSTRINLAHIYQKAQKAHPEQKLEYRASPQGTLTKISQKRRKTLPAFFSFDLMN